MMWEKEKRKKREGEEREDKFNKYDEDIRANYNIASKERSGI